MRCFFHVLRVKNLFFYINFYFIASALKSCLIKDKKKLKKNWEKFFLGQKYATTYDFVVGDRECNAERGFKNQLYIELGVLPILCSRDHLPKISSCPRSYWMTPKQGSLVLLLLLRGLGNCREGSSLDDCFRRYSVPIIKAQ